MNLDQEMSDIVYSLLSVGSNQLKKLLSEVKCCFRVIWFYTVNEFSNLWGFFPSF